MSTESLSVLNTTMKSLSMRREALYRAVTIGGVASWRQHEDEIDSLNESMESVEGERQLLCERLAQAQTS